MATNHAREVDSGTEDFTPPALVTAVNHLRKAFDEIHQFIIYFESRSSDIWKGEFKGEDMFQQHLESWRIAHNSLNFDDSLDEAGALILKLLQLARLSLSKPDKQSAMKFLKDLILYMPRLQALSREPESIVTDSILAFECDQEYFNMLIGMQNFQLSHDEKEIKSIEFRKDLHPKQTFDQHQIMSNCEQFSHLVDRKIKLHSEIAKRNKIKVILSDVTSKLAFLITSMKELVGTTAEKVYQLTPEQCKVFESINGLMNGGKIEEAQKLLDTAILEWELFTFRKNLYETSNKS